MPPADTPSPCAESFPSPPSRYEYSLASFLTVFNLTLNTSKKDSMLEGRLRNVTEALTFDVYNYTCLGLFERHKLMFSFQMTIKILEGKRGGYSRERALEGEGERSLIPRGSTPVHNITQLLCHTIVLSIYHCRLVHAFTISPDGISPLPPSSAGDQPLDAQFLDFFLKGNLSLEKARRGE